MEIDASFQEELALSVVRAKAKAIKHFYSPLHHWSVGFDLFFPWGLIMKKQPQCTCSYSILGLGRRLGELQLVTPGIDHGEHRRGLVGEVILI